VVAGPEIKNIRQLEVAHSRTTFLLREAGPWVLLCVFPTMMQQQQHSRDKEYTRYNKKLHTPSVQLLNNEHAQ
jgi:hypothetical protein